MFEGDVFDFDEKMQPLLKIMCGEVAKQKKRLGGDFAVAHAVVSRHVKDRALGRNSIEIFFLSFGLKNHLMFHFESVTCLKTLNFIGVGNLKPKLKWFSIELPPRVPILVQKISPSETPLKAPLTKGVFKGRTAQSFTF